MNSKHKGFTLAELLIVVAIISVLVAIAIPVFNRQIEKSRRAVDVSNARSIAAIFANLYNDGTFEFTSSDACVWVVVTSNGVNPGGYNVNINGSKPGRYYDSIRNLLKSNGLDPGSVKIHAQNAKDGDGWKWYVVGIEADGHVGIAAYPGTYTNNASDYTKYKKNVHDWINGSTMNEYFKS